MHAIGGGQYQFSSQVNSVTGGFFPLDPAGHGFPLYTVAPAGPGTPPQMVGTEAMLCNLWPYWHSTDCVRRGATVPRRPVPVPAQLDPADTTGVCPGGMNCNGKWYVGQQGWYHDFVVHRRGPLPVHAHGARSACSSTATTTCSSSSTASSSSTWAASTSVSRAASIVRAAGMATITEGGSLDLAGTTILPCPGADPYTGVTFNTMTELTATVT